MFDQISGDRVWRSNDHFVHILWEHGGTALFESNSILLGKRERSARVRGYSWSDDCYLCIDWPPIRSSVEQRVAVWYPSSSLLDQNGDRRSDSRRGLWLSPRNPHDQREINRMHQQCKRLDHSAEWDARARVILSSKRKWKSTFGSRPLENWMILLVVARNWEAPVHGLTLSLQRLIRRVFSRSGSIISSVSWWDLVINNILKNIETGEIIPNQLSNRPTRSVVETPCVRLHSRYRPADFTIW